VVFLEAQFGTALPCVDPKADDLQKKDWSKTAAQSIDSLLKIDQGGCDGLGLGLGKDDKLSSNIVSPKYSLADAALAREPALGSASILATQAGQFSLNTVKESRALFTAEGISFHPRAWWGVKDPSKTLYDLTAKSNNWKASIPTQFWTAYQKDKTTQVKLYARKRIGISCTKSAVCEKFADATKFKLTAKVTTMFASLASLKSGVKALLIWSMIFTIWGILYLFYVITKSKKQKYPKSSSVYLNTLSNALLVGLIVMIICWVVLFRSKNDFVAQRTELNELSGCITDPNWKVLPALLYSKTNLDSLHNWMIVWVVFTTLAQLGGIFVFFRENKILTALRKGGRGYAVVGA
jgi:hypothetical protein